MFAASPIRYLSRSEEIFAQGRNFVGLTVHLTGRVDVGAMTDAFDTLLRVHPVLGGQLQPGTDGRHQIVVDDYLHPGVWIGRSGIQTQLPDQSVVLVNLRVQAGDDQSEVTLYTHHAIADAHHQFALLEQLFEWYTATVEGVGPGQSSAEPTPLSLEAVLEERGIGKRAKSGLERLMPAMFAYDLPPSRRNPGGGLPLPVRVPVARCLLTRAETQGLVDFAAAQRVSLNTLVGAAILVAEWRLRDTPHVPIPYVYPVNLRYFLSPPVAATAATNPLGVATYLAEITSETDVVALARDIVDTFRSDLSDGVIQQSLLHFNLQYEGNPAGLPDVVMMTDAGEMAPLPTPQGLTVDEYHSEVLFESSAGFDMYSCGTYAGRLLIEYHTHAQEPERNIALIRDQLCAVLAENRWTTD